MTPPDSGEREAPNVIVEEGRDDYARYGANWDVMRAEGDDPNPEPEEVVLSLSLAQRILAALEESLEGECIALGAELRAIVERKP